MDCVEELATLVGLPEYADVRFDWLTIEASLGLSLPDDYKAMAESFPRRSRFQGTVGIIRPGDLNESESEYLGYYAHRLDDMRRWRDDEPDRFPYPIYPEPGGLLPWGTSKRGHLFFWLTSSKEPNAWSIISADGEFSQWREIPGPACRFLIEVVSGQFDGSEYGVNLAARGPWLKLPEPPPPPPPREQYWLCKQLFPTQPVNEFSAVVELLGARSGNVAPTDWAQAERRLGLRLPADYKSFIDTYGPGAFDGAVITAPGAPGADLFDLIERKRQQIAADTGRAEHDPPVHPEPGGMIPWGEAPDGWTCCWAQTGPDPDNWDVVFADPELRGYYYRWGTSFSSFLVKYAKLGDFFGGPFGVTARQRAVSFTPYRR